MTQIKTSLFWFQVCLWAQFISVYRTSDQAFKQKNKRKLSVQAKNPQYESDAVHVPQSSAWKCYLCWDLLWPGVGRGDGERDAVIRVKYCVCTVSEMTTGVTPIRPWDDLSVERGGGGGASAPARWPPGTSRALCLTKRQAFINPAGDGLWFIHPFSGISLSSCSLVDEVSETLDVFGVVMWLEKIECSLYTKKFILFSVSVH